MPIKACVPVIPSHDLPKTLRLWVEGLEFVVSSELYKDGKLVFCFLNKGDIWFILNQRAGTLIKPEDYNGIRLYWTPSDIYETRLHLKNLGYAVSELEERDYNYTEFFLTDDDGFSHCFGVPTAQLPNQGGTPGL